MEKEFVPMSLALKMKQLGFDEPCFAGFNPTPFDYDGVENLIYPIIHLEFDGEEIIYNDFQTEEPNIWTIDSDVILAPLYQQAFRWFREKYNLLSEIGLRDREDLSTWKFEITIIGKYEMKHNSISYNTHEEAELACLTKLIEIVETKTE